MTQRWSNFSGMHPGCGFLMSCDWHIVIDPCFSQLWCVSVSVSSGTKQHKEMSRQSGKPKLWECCLWMRAAIYCVEKMLVRKEEAVLVKYSKNLCPRRFFHRKIAMGIVHCRALMPFLPISKVQIRNLFPCNSSLKDIVQHSQFYWERGNFGDSLVCMLNIFSYPMHNNWLSTLSA